MNRSAHDLDPEVRQIFDRLRVTPQHFFDYKSGLAHVSRTSGSSLSTIFHPAPFCCRSHRFRQTLAQAKSMGAWQSTNQKAPT